MMSQLHHADVILIRVSHMGRVVWYSGRVSPFGRRRRVRHVARFCACGQTPRRRVTAIMTSDFDIVFTSGFVSSSSTRWYGQNIILTTFIFEQKSNTTLNHVLRYQLLGIPTGDVLIISYWRLRTLTQYLTWFGKSPTSMGESILLEIEKEYKTNTWRRRITSLYSTPNSHCCTCSCCNGSRLLQLQPFTFSLSLSIALTISLHYLSLSFCSQIMSLFMGISWQTIGHQLWHK